MQISSKTGLRAILIVLVLSLLLAGLAVAQGRPASPRGSASTQIGDSWIDVSYGRPILRGRSDIFGSGDSYGQGVYAGAPIWRVGADVTTRIKTELDLNIGGTAIPDGEYSFFIDLKEGAWTGVISTQEFMESPDRAKMAEGITWGAYGYSDEKDVVRTPMIVTPNEATVDQLTIVFSDVSDAGGNLVVVWANTIAVLPFTVAN